MALNLYQCNYVKELEEEIALEGLDGITTEALWTRMLDRSVCSIKPTNEQTKEFLWKAVIRMDNVKFYLLPSPRKPICIMRRDVFDKGGHYFEPDEPPDCYLYPHFPIENEGEMGSCPLYHERKNITSEVRNCSLQSVESRWGSALVIVANQKTRTNYLMEPESNKLMEMFCKQYCFLERVGRSRQHGEITQGKRGLQSITQDSKILHYYKKFLSKNKLIKQQLFYVKTSKASLTGLIIHLPRYSQIFKSKGASDVDNVVRHLKNQPGQYDLHKNVVEKFGEKIDVKKLLQRHSKKFQTEMVPYRQIYPDAPPSEWKVKTNTGEKSIRIFRLLENKGGEEEEEDDLEEDDDNEEGEAFLRIQYRTNGLSLIRQCFDIIDSAGPRGLSQNGVSKILGISNLHSRSLVKYLTKKKFCGSTTVDVGKQRITHYFSQRFENSAHGVKTEFEKEKSKLMKILAENSEEPVRKKVKVEVDSTISLFNSMPREETVLEGPTQEEIDAIETEITISDLPSHAKSVTSLLNDINSADSSVVTTRFVKRANLILETINTHRIIQDIHKLQKVINEAEESEGHKYTVDRKSVDRLLDKLVKDGLVRLMKIKLSGHGREKIINFVLHPSVSTDDSVIVSTIEQAKMKLPIIIKEISRVKCPKNTEDNGLGPSNKVSQSFKLGKYDSKAGRRYGLKPKFVKNQVLHSILFYLVYEHSGQEVSSVEIDVLLKSKNVDANFKNEMPPVYSTTGDWKTFIPPLPVHSEYTEGWCLVSDLLIRLPLSVFVSLVNIPYDVPTLTEYLTHPIKKYYLVKNLPSNICNTITLHRKYIFAISEIIVLLAYMGLVQLGPQKLKEKDQYFVYVNRNALLLDTTPSNSGYNHVSQDMKYESVGYEFKCLEDVEQYWYDLWNYAMNTNLGCKNVMHGKPVVIESVLTKKVLVSSTKSRTVTEAVERDIGYLPGDHLGAAGLDSDLFVHLKRNWYWACDGRLDSESGDGKTGLEQRKIISKRAGKKRDHSKEGEGVNSGQIKKIKLIKPVEHSDTSEDEADDTSIMKDKTKLIDGPSEKTPPWHVISKKRIKGKSKKITRILKRKESNIPRKPYYDQVDKVALSRMVKLRVDWSPTEDNLLLICKVASLYMSAESRRHVAKNFCVIRELLHTTYPLLSQNKTSRACQRRMLYMMKNPSTAHSVYLCLEEIKQDPEISDRFGMAVEKLDRQLKLIGKGPKTCQADYDKVYTDLVQCLLAKLKTISTPEEATLKNTTIPDTVREFRDVYNIVVPKNLSLRYGSYAEVQNIVDIMCAVVNVVIHSSLCCSGDKTSYSYQLFYVYQQYPDKLLRSVMARCRSMQIVSCRKRYKRWKTANSGCLPLSSSPYQLSITYINILQTRYQYCIFYENKLLLDSILKKCANLKASISSQPSSSSAILPNDKITIDFRANNGGECAAVVELFSNDCIEVELQFPQNLIVLDPRLSEQEESYTLIMKRFKELLTIANANNKLSKDCDDGIEEDDDLNSQRTANADDESALNEEFNLSNKSGIANMASRLALYMMRDEPLEQMGMSVQHAHDYFVLKPCKIRLKVDEAKIKSKIVSAVKQQEIIKEIQKMAIFPQEIVETTDIVDKFSDRCSKTVLESVIAFIETKKELGAFHKDILSHVNGSADEINDCLQLLVDDQLILKSGNVHNRFIHSKYKKPWLVRSYHVPRNQRERAPRSNVNVSYAIQLKKASDDEGTKPSDSLEPNEQSGPNTSNTVKDKPVEDLSPPNGASSIQEDESEKTGSKSSEPVVVVLRNKKKRWASLKENKFGSFDFSTMNPILVNMRPWIRVDGTLNRRVLDRLLGSILGHCLSMPGLRLKTLQDRFMPALQPAHTYDLVLILQKIGSVRLGVVSTCRPSLLSRRQPVIEGKARGFEDPATVSVNPQLLAVSLLGQFLSSNNVGNDYLEAFTDARQLTFS